jgi:hypothetical protein
MAVIDQHRLCVGMLETCARFCGHCRSVAARMSGFNVTGGNTDSRGGVWGVDWLAPQAYNISVIMAPSRLTFVSRGASFGTCKVRAGDTAIVRATIA